MVSTLEFNVQPDPLDQRTPGIEQPQGPEPPSGIFGADTWVFLPPAPGGEVRGVDWGLGFGPADVGGPRWSLFRCVGASRFDARLDFASPYPSETDLLRWSSPIIGSAASRALLDCVGSCTSFYAQYLDERPDLRWIAG